MDLRRQARQGITPQSAGWKYLSFKTLTLEPGQKLADETRDDETALVWLSGKAELEGMGGVGERSDVWEGKPHAVLLPAGSSYRLEAQTACEIALISAPANGESSARAIRPEKMSVESRGSGVTQRTIHWILPETQPASRLILVEVFTPAGHWSTFPPHKHDTDDAPRERALEELYYYRFKRREGFAFQAIYTRDRSLDVSLRTHHDDLVLVPRGYHVVSAAPGYDCYYLNAMAGPVREWLFTTDPDHAWLMDWKKPS